MRNSVERGREVGQVHHGLVGAHSWRGGRERRDIFRQPCDGIAQRTHRPHVLRAEGKRWHRKRTAGFGPAADYVSEDGGHSPLLEAVRLRHERVIRTLLAAGADATLTYTVEARTLYTEQAFSGRLTALHLIAMEQKPPPSQELVKPAEEDAEHEEMERRQVWWWDGTRAPSQPSATPHPPLRTRCQPQDCAPTTLCTL